VGVAGLTAVQLHGGLDERLAQRLNERFGGRVGIVQALHWEISPRPGEGAGRSADEVAAQMERVAATGAVDRILIDSKLGAASGGTGASFDWTEARGVFAAAPKSVRLIVAGGLTPENVARAILTVGPWGVDVASGVEASPGRKDPTRLALFLKNARG
jgi:phosphoribosylanthranilate isomerase